jgi:PAS domain S-box-containing protein
MTQHGSHIFHGQLRTLIIEDSQADAELIQHALRKGGISAVYKRVCTADDLRQEIEGSTWDLILCDCHMPGFSAEAALRIWLEYGEDAPFIILSCAIGEEDAVALLKAGAHDFIIKDNLSRLIPAIERELREVGERKLGRRRQDDLKKAEDALRQSEAKYRRLHESMMDAFVIVDMNGYIQECNQTYQTMLGYTEDELRRLTYIDLTPPKWFEMESRIVNEEIIPNGHSCVYEKEYIRKDGTVFPVELRTFLLRDDAGEPAAMWAIVRDITQRKQSEEEVKTANAELLSINSVILASSSCLDLHVILDKIMDEAIRRTGLEGGTICLVNPDETLELAAHRATSVATILDLTTNSVRIGECLCGECARDRTPLILPDRDAVLQYATREAARGEDIRFHAAFPLITADKCVGVLCVFSRSDQKPSQRSLKLLETVSAQIALAIDNARLYAESVQHGATLEKKVAERTADIERAQTALLNLLDDVNKTKNDLEQANNKLKELDRLKSMFIASMSHELRTPLNSIIGFTGIILQGLAGSINAEQKDQLERVFSSGQHLLSLINDVIDVSKIESGRVDVHLSECSLVAVITEAAASFQQTIQKKGLMLEVSSPANIKITTDRRRLLQCIMNYLSNAVKYSRKGTIRIEATQTQNSVLVRVRDMGIGISEADLPKLFNAFVRLDSELKILETGSGLGLYLTRKIVTELLGGSVSAESVLGVGSIFSLSVPVKLECAMEVS